MLIWTKLFRMTPNYFVIIPNLWIEVTSKWMKATQSWILSVNGSGLHFSRSYIAEPISLHQPFTQLKIPLPLHKTSSIWALVRCISTMRLKISESCVVSVDIQCSSGRSDDKKTPVWIFYEVMEWLPSAFIFFNCSFWNSILLFLVGCFIFWWVCELI